MNHQAHSSEANSTSSSERRLELVEETLFERTSDDRASAAERFYVLVNATSGGDGWRDVTLAQHKHNVRGGVLLAPASQEAEDWDSAAREHQKWLRKYTEGRELGAKSPP